MKKAILIILFTLTIFSLSAQQMYIGGILGMSVNNGFDQDPKDAAQRWRVRAIPFYGAQAGLSINIKSKENSMLKIEFIHRTEGNSYYIKFVGGPNPNEEYYTFLKRSFLQVNVISNYGGFFKNHPKFGLMGGAGLSLGHMLASSPKYKSNTMEYWPIDNISVGSNFNFSIILSTSVFWKIGIGVLEFSPRFRQSVLQSFGTPGYHMEGEYNTSLEFNLSYLIPLYKSNKSKTPSLNGEKQK